MTDKVAADGGREPITAAEGPAERAKLLYHLEDWLETPMIVLSFAWLALVLAELIWATPRLVVIFGTVIWVIFILEFLLRLGLAPEKPAFLKRNWLTVIALVVPAFRMFRIFRVLRFARTATRGLRLVRVVGTANRGMNALRASMRRRGLGYVLALSAIVIFLGAGGMFAFEPAGEVEGGLHSYSDALWWTAMLLTSIGSEYWPRSPEGRLLCFLLSLYGLAVFGYITASFASYFVGRDAEAEEAELVGAADVDALRRELQELRAALEGRSRADPG